MKKFYFILFISYFILNSLLNAEIVKSVQINGNQRVSDETIKVYGEIKINKNYLENDLDEIIKNLYSTEFFEDVNVKISNNVLIINLKEYPVINQLIISGETSNRIKNALVKNMSLKEKSSFIRSKLSKDIEIIKKLYSSVGYNFSKIETKLKKIDENNIDLIILVDKGSQTKISSINFIGDKKIKDRRLRDIIASEEDKFYKFISKNTKFSQNLVDLDLRLLNNYYKSLGYYDVNITSNSAELNKDGNIDLIYSIDAGNRYSINKIVTNLDPTFDKNLFYSLNKEYDKFIGEFYSPFKIKELLEEIDLLIERNNLQFVEHNVEEIIDGSNITIKFNIFEGERKLVERIDVFGNNITNESVIRGELLLDEGDPFTKLNLDKSVAKLKARNIFNQVSTEVKDGSENNLKIIGITVEEKPTGEISAGAGIGTDGGSFGIVVSENNWLGGGKKINFELDLDQESIGGTFNYSDPNYNFLGNSINYYLSSTDNDKPDQGFENTIISAGVGTGFEQYKNIFTNIGLSASYDDLRTVSSASSSLQKQSGEFSEIAGNYGIRFDSRNRAFMPSSGGIVSFSQTLPLIADKSYISNVISTSTYKSITEDIIGSAKFFLSTIDGLNNDDVRLSKRVNLSTNRLRGFKKNKVGPVDGGDHIGGNYATALNLEANLPNLLPESTNIDVGFFLDFGNVWGVDYDETIDESNKIRSATGAAASWISPLGPMTFILSTDLSKDSTDESESFNFRLGTTF